MLILTLCLFIATTTTDSLHAMEWGSKSKREKIDEMDSIPDDYGNGNTENNEKPKRKSKPILGRVKSELFGKKNAHRSKSVEVIQTPRESPVRRSSSAEAIPETRMEVDISTLNLSGVAPTQQPLTISRNHDLLELEKLTLHEIPPIISFVKNDDIESLQEKSFSAEGINAQDHLGTTALMWAICLQRPDMVALLLAHPLIDIHLQDASGDTALHYAASTGNKKIMQQLLACPYLRVNMQNKKELSALHCAAQLTLSELLIINSLAFEIVNLLAKDPRITFYIKDSHNKTPQDLIDRKHRDERVALFHRVMLDVAVNRAIIEYLKYQQVLWDGQFKLPDIALWKEASKPGELVDVAHEYITEIIQDAKSYVLKDWRLPDYVDDKFIEEMIVARINGLTPYK